MAGFSPWGRKESDMTEQLSTHMSLRLRQQLSHVHQTHTHIHTHTHTDSLTYIQITLGLKVRVYTSQCNISNTRQHPCACTFM